jgi:lipopolysaccharide/colanic/teichoic acid biosynthesis glycosyltransferase
MEAHVWMHHALKRAIDLVGALAGLVVLGVPMALIALAIKLSDRHAPVLFRQDRCGQGARRFRLVKFRTMVPDADALKEDLRRRSVATWPDFRLADDPRVTRLGRVLRRSSLDELPQLWNVLRGDMSLVGPRPTSFAADTYTLWQTERLEHRPGITGPWQVHGRTEMDFDERCRLEIAFFRRPSLLRELWLIVATLGVVLKRTGVA